MKKAHVMGCLVLASIIAAVHGAQNGVGSNGGSIRVGAVVGAQYVKAGNRFFLYATLPPPKENLGTQLFPAEVVELTRLNRRFPEASFSLDLEKRPASEPIREGDIADWREIASRLKATEPLARWLKARPGLHEALAALPAEDEKKRLSELRKLAAILDRARKEPQLFGLVDPDDVSSETAGLLKQGARDPRAGRMILEDYLGGVVRPVWKRFVIAYKPPSLNDGIKGVLGDHVSELLLTRGDAVLKTLGYKAGPADIPLASELLMCAAEDAEVVSQGKSIGENASWAHVLFFQLQTGLVPAPELEGSGFWFESPGPRLVVKAASAVEGKPVRECSMRFARNVTAALPKFLGHDSGLGADVRNLMGLLLVNRAVDFAASSGDVDEGKLNSIATQVVKNVPPPAENFPILFPKGDRITGSLLIGGVVLNESKKRVPGTVSVAATVDASGHAGTRRTPEFIVDTVEVPGRGLLLRIECTALVGMGERVEQERKRSSP